MYRPYINCSENTKKIIQQTHNKLLVGPMMIDVGLGRENHSSIPATAIRRGLKPLDARTNPEPN